MRRAYKAADLLAALALCLPACASGPQPPLPRFNISSRAMQRCEKAGGRCVNTLDQLTQAPPWPCGERYHAVDDVTIVLEDGSIEHGAGCLSEAAGEERCCMPDQ